MNRECEKVREALLDMVYANASMGDIARHLEECSECRDYVGALADIAVVLSAQRDDCTPLPGVESAASSGAVAGASPDWARLSSTIERGVKLRMARERRTVGIFALSAAGILAAVWTPLLARSPHAFLALQVAGFSGIALFYLPIHVLRARRGDDM
ncbi:MAG TPA: hypothetical protein DCL63_12865 [Firmicutes bacterium]|jgi:hypothetical protein|nr:hypothetical protein [Bacillota bacterium]HBK60987.1 hypothetical protein [Bacillota bacterium]